ncbi:hypothetical protein DSM112329_01375 [Paraconexibacter sp. AEG42_29]|uniref:PepSY domain-containing protein n=1 Tax=Paraconexibacter sp. AEG42_29 TaxID=2997339 RepID=A0AAU7ASG3_9ACTN
MRKTLMIAAAALAAAVPATALAKHGADDGAQTSTTTTATTTTGTTTTGTTATTTPARGQRITTAQRASAIRAAKAVVPAAARVTKVERETDDDSTQAYEVKLRTRTVRYEVDLDRAFKVLDVDRDRIGVAPSQRDRDDDRSNDRNDDRDDDRGGRGRGSDDD